MVSFHSAYDNRVLLYRIPRCEKMRVWIPVVDFGWIVVVFLHNRDWISAHICCNISRFDKIYIVNAQVLRKSEFTFPYRMPCSPTM